MITIYTKSVTKRLQYTVDFIFNEICSLPFTISNDIQTLNGFVINYSNEQIDVPSYHICPSGLLDDESNLYPEIVSLKDQFFQLFPSKNADHQFDVFSAIFFLITRMEEYEAKEVDEHGRYISSQSILVQHKVNHIPIVDVWVYDLIDQLNHCYHSNFQLSRKYKQYVTIDIDNAYAFKYKGFWRSFGGTVKDGITNKTKFKQRLDLWKGNSDDPYDTYGYLNSFSKKLSLEVVFFILLGDYAKYDKNIDHNHPKMIELLGQLKKFGQLGIHPSYQSFGKPHLINQEKERLKDCIDSNVSHSRFHFLRYTMPDSYRNLLKCGIENDYSMGYADQYGFRAGTCTPFYFYDLKSESKTSLKIHPFAYMEGVLKDYYAMDTKEATNSINQLKEAVQKVNGVFTSIWHNESLSDKDRWKGWRSVFESSWV